MNIELSASQTIFPARTDFQLRKFVIGQHDTAPMQWKQIVLEAQELLYNIRMAELNIEKQMIQIERLLATGDRLDEIEAEEKQLAVVVTQRALYGARRELDCLRKIASEIGEYTIEDIEKDQPEYWSKRIKRQADTDAFGAANGITPSNVASMVFLGMLQQEEQCAISPGN